MYYRCSDDSYSTQDRRDIHYARSTNQRAPAALPAEPDRRPAMGMQGVSRRSAAALQGRGRGHSRHARDHRRSILSRGGLCHLGAGACLRHGDRGNGHIYRYRRAAHGDGCLAAGGPAVILSAALREAAA